MKAIIRPAVLIAITSLTAGLLFDTAYGQTAPMSDADKAVMVERLDTIASAQAEAVYNALPEFRLLTQLEPLPIRTDTSVNIEIPGKFKGLGIQHRDALTGFVATIHDPKTGRPLESCITPCELSLGTDEDVLLIRYKTAYRWSGEITNSKAWKRTVKQAPYQLLNYPLIEQTQRRQIRCDNKVAASTKVNGDAKPCLRVSPLMAPKAVTSGHCDVSFDVTAQGFLSNQTLIGCSTDVYAKNSLDVLKHWRYYPKKIDGRAVMQKGITDRIAFALDNGRGERL